MILAPMLERPATADSLNPDEHLLIACSCEHAGHSRQTAELAKSGP
jgi:hypothetical protein